jgi:transposase
MQRRHAISDEQWTLIEHLLPGQGIEPGRVAEDNRLFIDAVFWIAKTGAPWRDLPERFGCWNSVYRRFSRWCRAGVWQRVLYSLAGEPDLEELILDSTIVRAHAHAAGASKKSVVGNLSNVSVVREVVSAPRFMSRSTHRANQSN